MTGERRGGHVLDAAIRLIAADGLAAVSIRAVAAEAGVSLAQVQYYFRSKEELVTAALEQAEDEFLAQVALVLERPRSRRRLRAAIDLWLPLDEERERRVKVWLAFVGAAAARPALAEQARQTDEQLRGWYRTELAALGVADPDAAAAHLLALVDGVALQSLALPRRSRPALVRRTVDAWLDRLPGGDD
ncbi:AcrR family transcriptional regulator [Nocardioides luteus]|uniref:HTH-type transcriptional regulator PksA n=1 Tax=Nocardioides luteus TaxID=1844 RepID=A0ABQ5SQY3_9ACTN|nr:TetR/AcrR family transcriptional regulator [Nocardioides luteus]MDR7312942.1 AcrR family transcriptional regulator [Nocardioides luteus]GGR45194.1 HTH-type transcriptional regulator PksA [Nocardioides luteus]GLJ66003.1 HTH-type transcriptional regulator PksA [Nocardioides luteus]